MKDSIVSGSLRVTDTTYTNDLILGKTYTARYVLAAPTADGVPAFRALTNADVGLGNVENTKLSTWQGTSNVKTLGTVTTGTWNATIIGVAYGGTGVNSSSTAINKVFASPGSGSAGAPTFRELVAADIPTLSITDKTSGTLTIDRGGTGATNATDAKTNIGLGHIFYGTCDTAAATVDKVVTCAEFTKTVPDIGDVLFVKFTYTNSGARGSLNLQIGDKENTKKPLRWLNNAGVAQIPGNGYIVANHTYEFYYDGTNWIIDLQYDSNTNDTATLIRNYGGNVAIVTTTTVLYYCELLFSVVDTNNGWKAIPANTTKKGHGSTAKTNIFTSEFNPFGDIYYYITDADVAANATVRADRVYKQYPVDIRYSFNCGQTLTAGKDVYLVAYMTDSCKAKLRNPGALDSNAAATATGANAGPITQTLPTSADGYIYIKLGPAYSNYQFDLTLDHPIYYHDGVAIRLLAQTTSYGTTLPANGKEGQTFFQVSDPWYELPPGGTTGQLLMKTNNNDRAVSWSTGVYISGDKLFGAAWNDYAECRNSTTSKPGTCVIENDNGQLTIATERLIPGATIISDTYGMCIGKTETAAVPTAITGRVLAYTYQPRENYHAGMAVCSAPDGTIDIMTRDEIREYPDAIIGIVSEIPTYDTWGKNDINVDNRIWIKIK